MLKSLLLSLTLLSAVALSAAVPQRAGRQSLSRRIYNGAVPSRTAVFTPVSRATGSMSFGYAGEIYTAFMAAMEDGVEAAAAIGLDEETTTAYAGNKITKVIIPTGPDCKGMPLTVFVTDKLQDLTQNSVKGTFEANDWENNEYTLPAPVEIKAGTRLYVGYTMVSDLEKYTYPICIDYVPTDNENALLTAEKHGNRWQWDSFAESYGALNLAAVIEGDNLPENLGAIALTGESVITTGDDIMLGLTVTNRASNPVENIDVTVKVADQDPEQYKFDVDLSDYNASTVIKFGVKCVTSGNNLPVTVTLDKVNGVEQSAAPTASFAFLSLPEGTGFKRNMVVEEYTGTWCGWCPRGITGLHNMLAAHPDGSFIPVAVHFDDEMAMDYGASASGFPSSDINRMAEYADTDPDEEYLAEIYDAVTSMPAFAMVEVASAKDGEGKVKVTTSSRFSLPSAGGEYGVAIVITENEVGPYVQHNYYPQFADVDDMALPGDWVNLPEEVSIKFNDVARYINAYEGEPVYPAGVTTDEVYSNDFVVSVPEGVNVDNCNVVALIVNKATGVIENGAFAKIGSSAVTAIRPDSGSSVRVDGRNVIVNEGIAAIFTPDGRRVATATAAAPAQLQRGIYLVRTATGTAKVAIR